jgi:hypothetical protein
MGTTSRSGLSRFPSSLVGGEPRGEEEGEDEEPLDPGEKKQVIVCRSFRADKVVFTESETTARCQGLENRFQAGRILEVLSMEAPSFSFHAAVSLPDPSIASSDCPRNVQLHQLHLAVGRNLSPLTSALEPAASQLSIDRFDLAARLPCGRIETCQGAYDALRGIREAFRA